VPARQQDAIELAYRFIDRRERTVAEVTLRLERAELEPEEIAVAVAELIALGYLDDARFARVFAEDKRNLEEWGSDRIARTLLERGVDPELVAQAIAQPGEDELEQALALLRRRFPAPPEDRRERERAFGVLLRKGYDSELALDAVRAWGRSDD
jgi:regulatory protein